MYPNTRVSLRAIVVVAVSLLLLPAIEATAPASPSRRGQLVEANIVAVHAYQILLARKAGKSNACYPDTSPDTAALQQLVNHQQSLLAEPSEQVARWADSMQTSFDPAKDLQPLLHAKLTLSPDLPVNVFTRYLRAEAPQAPEVNIRSVANLYQTVLEVERDGDILQDLYHFYIALKLPVYVGQFGLPGSDADMLVAAQKLAGKSCASPFGLSVPEWQIAGRKIWNWGEKNLHIRDANTLARELLAEPQIAKLIPSMKAMPAEKIVILGHSFTMDLHWSSPSSFVPIVTAMFVAENPRVQFWQGSAGGQTYSRAYKNFYPAALAYKPNLVLFVLTNRTAADVDALKTMAAGFRAEGARVMMFDDVEDSEVPYTTPEQTAAIAKAAGVEIIPARAILDAAPDHASFPCMDGIHKTEPYHRLMAALWLKAILATNQRGPHVALEHPQRQPAVASTAVAGRSAADSLSR
ncbi:MAG TPA: hypothetical protein VFC39_17760 [Acidobacteriaceae bacterium]|nr:hypothetical protein [Acidobacteriaceae bacterium]